MPSRPLPYSLVILIMLMCRGMIVATETENLDLMVLPAPGPVSIDGGSADWDLSAGVFSCADVENARGTYSVWTHAMWDAEKLYIFARWQDLTPLSNPGSIKGDYGFNGDCLQIRVLTAPDAQLAGVAEPDPTDVRDHDDPDGVRTTHLTCWRDRDGLDSVNVAWGRRFKEGGCEGKEKGAIQAFRLHADGRGYDQELAIPWSLLSRGGWKPTAGARICLTVEPNFNIAGGGRLTVKDIFKPDVPIDRVFTFQGPNCWGYATLSAAGAVPLRPVRLSDGREFPVAFVDHQPAVDWTGLARGHEPEGFMPITFTMPAAGFASINIFRADGSVARQLLTCAAFEKGDHEVLWDGLGTMSVRQPALPLPAGEYSWGGLWHTGIHLHLRGWAASSGSAPWGNVWGSDHGNPIACAADHDRIYVGWHGGEGAKPLLACDTHGTVLWKNIRGGIATASLVASDGETVYVWNDIGQYATRCLYRVNAASGAYTDWSANHSPDLTMKELWGDRPEPPDRPSGIAAGAGKVYLTFEHDLVVVVDATSGAVITQFAISRPSDIKLGPDGRLYVVSAAHAVESIDCTTYHHEVVARPQVGANDWISALAIGTDGGIYVGIRGDDHHVEVYSPDGKLQRTIGRPGGRALLGAWNPDGMYNIAGMAIDGEGQLWVAEDDASPRRVSVWQAATGAFKTEFFGASTYGAIGGVINPADPQLMVGQGCEWRVDAKSGRSSCLGVITREGMGACRFGFGPDHREYLAVTPGFLQDHCPIRIFERLGDGEYRLRTVISAADKQVRIWADENGDGIEQPNEVTSWPDQLGGWFQGWYMPMTPDMAFYGSLSQVRVSGWTTCHAPRYDLGQTRPLPGPADGNLRGGMGAQHNHGSIDGRFVLWNGLYGEDHTTFDCFDIESGRLMWTYPNTFTGVHGSHRACSGEGGLIRGAYDITGAIKLPDPIGNAWVIPTNKGEWHLLSEHGYYLCKLFEGDPMKVDWPVNAQPGADLDHCPPGAGEEAFGGSVTQGIDGSISVQAGHSSFWNVAVTGFETVKALPGGRLELTDAQTRIAEDRRKGYVQRTERKRHLTVPKATPVFSGSLAKDFPPQALVTFAKQDDAAVSAALTWDDHALYAAWDVKDDSPWINGADAPEFMYARGDTVDLQLGTDEKAHADRSEAVLGDLRLSIGPFHGQTMAVIYRKVSAVKHQKSFHSGVIAEYAMDSVTVLDDARITVTVDRQKHRYLVEAAIPLADLGIIPRPGLPLRGDLGVTHGNKAGDRTVLRSYWCNQSTGLVSDEVYELQLVPMNWGELQFGQ